MATVQAPERLLIGELRAALDDLVRLGKLEVELAKIEAATAIKRSLIGAGIVIGALLLLLIGAVYAIGSLPKNLLLLDHWWGWLVTAGGLWILAGLVAFVGVRMILKAVGEAKTTVASMKGDVEWLRHLATPGDSAS